MYTYMFNFSILFQFQTIGHQLHTLSLINKLVKFLKYHLIVLLSQLMVMLTHLVVIGFAWVNYPMFTEQKPVKKQGYTLVSINLSRLDIVQRRNRCKCDLLTIGLPIFFHILFSHTLCSYWLPCDCVLLMKNYNYFIKTQRHQVLLGHDLLEKFTQTITMEDAHAM